MVQEFNVVRCFACEAFQVEQVKKSTNKWKCKLCNEKQSLKQIFFNGTGKDCRLNCQDLNMKRHKKEIELIEQLNDSAEDEIVPVNNGELCTTHHIVSQERGGDKWVPFLEEGPEVDSEENESSSVTILFRGEQKVRNERKRKQTENRKRSAKSMKASTFTACSDENNYENVTHEKFCESRIYSSSASKPSDRLRPIRDFGGDNCFEKSWDSTEVHRASPLIENHAKNDTSQGRVLKDCSAGKVGSFNSNNVTRESKWTKFLSIETEELLDDDL